MRRLRDLLPLALLGAVLAGCGGGQTGGEAGGESDAASEAEERGPNGGRILRDGAFAVELAIYEEGVPPEFRAWVASGGRPVAPEAVDLTVELTRLGGRVDTFSFAPQRDHLRGDGIVHEPHSFVVAVEATYNGTTHRWQYDSFEGRTTIPADVAAAFGLATATAGPAVLRETATLYGRIVPDPARVSEVSARFDGTITAVAASVGDTVQRGDALATIESNDSLRSYDLTAPIAGVVTERAANVGEQTRGRALFTILDPSEVLAELAIFPTQRERIRVGAAVTVTTAAGASAAGTIEQIGVAADALQAVTARVPLANADGTFAPGTHATATVLIAEHEVPLAVRRTALQPFRDFTVVFAQYGDVYEVRMLELGRQDAEWAEVLGGLEPGTRYVTDGSYVLKADVEKSGASHDH